MNLIDLDGRQSVLTFPRTITTYSNYSYPRITISIPIPPVLPIPITNSIDRINSQEWENIELGDTRTWPQPPVEGKLTEGDPSREKPKARGEKSLYDDKGGEWRPHKPDKYHPEGHWDYKPIGKNSEWQDIYTNFIPDKNANIWECIILKYQEWLYKKNIEEYKEDLIEWEQNNTIWN